MTDALRFDGVRVAPWIVPRLEYARAHGWHGVVLSGVRTPEQQLAAAARYAASLGKTVKTVYPRGPLASNHVGLRFPRGAVDVTDAGGLASAMERWTDAGKPRPLVWGGPVINDTPHFSSSGH